jgi:hypothetical protein
MVIEEKKQVRKLVVYTQPILSLIDKNSLLTLLWWQAKVEQACVYNRKLFNCSVSKSLAFAQKGQGQRNFVLDTSMAWLCPGREDGLFAHQQISFCAEKTRILTLHTQVHTQVKVTKNTILFFTMEIKLLMELLCFIILMKFNRKLNSFFRVPYFDRPAWNYRLSINTPRIIWYFTPGKS